MAVTERTWHEVLALKEHYLALDITDIHLWKDQDTDEMPWEYLTEVKPGSLWRFETNVSVNFKAQIDDFIFTWSLDLEKKGSNGSGSPQPDIERISAVLLSIPEPFQKDFINALKLFKVQLATHASEAMSRYKELHAALSSLDLIFEIANKED